jgi:hypothetical protein
MYVLMNPQCQYWDGAGWDSAISEAVHYPTEEDSDEDALDILDEYGIAAHAVEVDEPDEDEE